MALAKQIHESDFFPIVRRLLRQVNELEEWFRKNRRAFERRGIRFV